jgi:pimeloyl-[acyl-carrier protein] methyl ester esterase
MTNNLILIAGWGFKSSIWDSITDNIKDFNILTIDIKQALDDDYVRSLPDNSILIGWSFGGMAAVDIYLKYPSKFKKLILVASSPKFIEEHNYLGVTKAKAEEFYLNYICNPKMQLINFVKLIQYPNKDLSIKKILEDHLDDRNLSIYLKQLFEWDFRNQYQMIKIPILHIIGNKDAIISINNYPSNHQINIINAAPHALFLTHREEFQTSLMEFISNESR